MNQVEQRLQENIVVWLRAQGVLFCASGGGMHTPNKLAAVRMKRAGYVAGHPDIFIYEPRGRFHGLALELKVSTGRKAHVAESQKWWQNELTSRGYLSIIVPTDLDYYGAWDWVVNQLTNYLSS